jgi:hypothetical protein
MVKSAGRRPSILIGAGQQVAPADHGGCWFLEKLDVACACQLLPVLGTPRQGQVQQSEVLARGSPGVPPAACPPP